MHRHGLSSQRRGSRRARDGLTAFQSSIGYRGVALSTFSACLQNCDFNVWFPDLREATGLMNPRHSRMPVAGSNRVGTAPLSVEQLPEAGGLYQRRHGVQQRELGNSGLKVSAIGFGCMGLNFSYGEALSKVEAITRSSGARIPGPFGNRACRTQPRGLP